MSSPRISPNSKTHTEDELPSTTPGAIRKDGRQMLSAENKNFLVERMNLPGSRSPVTQPTHRKFNSAPDPQFAKNAFRSLFVTLPPATPVSQTAETPAPETPVLSILSLSPSKSN